MNKLKSGDIIRIHGWVMLKGIEGELKVAHVDDVSYWFTKRKGKKIVARHFKSNVDSWIKDVDNNRIEII